jgi:hypothetical protein
MIFSTYFFIFLEKKKKNIFFNFNLRIKKIEVHGTIYETAETGGEGMGRIPGDGRVCLGRTKISNSAFQKDSDRPG